jgi:hypothetical protein
LKAITVDEYPSKEVLYPLFKTSPLLADLSSIGCLQAKLQADK